MMGVLIMKFVTLVEDTTKCELGAEHGLSIYAETEKHKLLFDVGTQIIIRMPSIGDRFILRWIRLLFPTGTMTMAAVWMLFWRSMTML